MSAIVILGAGELGGLLAHRIARAGIARRVVLVDDAAAVAAGKALDIQQSGPVEQFSTRLTGTADLSEMIGAAAVVIADRHQPKGEWRDEDGLQLLRRVRGFSRVAPVICAGAAQTTLVERGVHELGFSPGRLFASSPEALRAAITALTALEIGCPPGQLALGLLGTPPSNLFVPWESASCAGHPLTGRLPPHHLAKLNARLRQLWPPEPGALASAAARAVEAMHRKRSDLVCVLAASGEPGSRGARATTRLVQLDPLGVARWIEATVTPRDRVQLVGER